MSRKPIYGSIESAAICSCGGPVFWEVGERSYDPNNKKEGWVGLACCDDCRMETHRVYAVNKERLNAKLQRSTLHKWP